MANSTYSRRNFLQALAKTTLGGAGAYASLGSLSMINAYAATPSSSTDDYRALVCLFLYGGNDSYNMFVPRNGDDYNDYAEARQNLAIEKNQILGVTTKTTYGTDYGFHPAMSDVRSLFNNENLAVMANVGAIITPTTREDYTKKKVPLPPRLFSHNDQQDFWQSMSMEASKSRGWAGRMADAMISSNANKSLPMNISMTGSNLLQIGENTLPYSMSSSGVETMHALHRDTNNTQQKHLIAAFDKLMQDGGDSLYSQEFAKVKSRAEALLTDMRGALAEVPSFRATKPTSNTTANDLEAVAKTIAARDTLGTSRQIFFVGVGGWDTHSDQLKRHSDLLGKLSSAMNYFYKLTKELGVADQVTTFTAADFGRTLTSNGDGTDHGWGSHQLVMGGAVKGKEIYGQMPETIIDGPQDSGRGRIIPTTSIDQYSATLAGWYGLPANDIAEIFPNLGNFDQTDMGFMAT